MPSRTDRMSRQAALILAVVFVSVVRQTDAGRQLLQAAPGPKIAQVVVLGDSYSDTGRLYFQYQNQSVPDPMWYYYGRFSSGPTWSEYLGAMGSGQSQLFNYFPVANSGPNGTLSGLTVVNSTAGNSTGLQVVSIALGGSPACLADKDIPLPNGKRFIVPVMDAQVTTYLQMVNGTTPPGVPSNYTMKIGAPEQRAVILEFGANDLLNQVENVTNPNAHYDLNLQLTTLPEDVARCIQNSTTRLIQAGEQNIILFSLPIMSRIPQAEELGLALVINWLANISERFNTALRQAVQELQAAYPTARVVVYELGNATSQALDHPERFGFTVTNQSCLQYVVPNAGWIGRIPILGGLLSRALNGLFGSKIVGRCANDRLYFFHDRVHPTTRVHSLIGEDLLAFMQTLGWR